MEWMGVRWTQEQQQLNSVMVQGTGEGGGPLQVAVSMFLREIAHIKVLVPKKRITPTHVSIVLMFVPNFFSQHFETVLPAGWTFCHVGLVLWCGVV
ncbi:unnamed protein product [Calypogeia fissa]